MTEGGIPSFFSWQFHGRFLPRTIWRRLTGVRDPRISTHVRIEPILALVACLGLAAVTAQSARRGSFVGILLLGLAVVGVLLLVVHSAWTARGNPVVPDAFAIGPFVACVILGGDLGLAIGRGTAITTMTRVAYAVIGMIVGYVVGTMVGLHTQRLGWIAGFFSFFAFAASAGLILLAVILFV